MGQNLNGSRHTVGDVRRPAALIGTGRTGRRMMHRLLEKQVKDATRPDGELDLEKLIAAIDSTYGRTEEERRGIVRSMQLMSDEATALTRELRESTASQLQAVLDHVKDVIMTVDEAGHIVSLNATGQRVFGHLEAE